MIRTLLFALTLSPALAFAQSGMQSTSAAPATLEARAVAPARLAAAAPAAAPKPDAASPLRLREEVVVSASPSLLDTHSATISFSFGDSHRWAAPRLVHVVGRHLPSDAMNSDVTSDVVVHMFVNEKGSPEDITVTHSGGADVDAKTLEAVRQYRFEPAVESGLPVASEVSLNIKLEKR